MPYLLQVKGFTGDAVWNDIFPVFTYSFFACTLLAAPATQARPQGVSLLCCKRSHSPRCLQVFGCKPCIVAGALCRLATRFLLLYGHSLTSMRVMQVAYGAGVSAEVVFSAYVFARVVRKSRVTAFSPAMPATHRSACPLAGPGAIPERHQRHRCSRADGAPHRRRGWPARHHSRRVADQPLLRQPVHRGACATHMHACTLNLLTSSAPHRQAGGTALSLLLPSEPVPPASPAVSALPPIARARSAASRVAGELRQCYASGPLALLSAWWALGSVAGFYTEDYGTNLFADIDPRQDANGHVTFVTRLLCTAAALLVIRLERPVAATGLWLYVLGAALAGVSIAALAAAKGLVAAYAAYVAALTVLQFCTCALYAQCAHALDDAAAGDAEPDGEDGEAGVRHKAVTAPKGRAAVLFATNQTVALALQAAIQAFATTTRAPPRTQFAALAGCVCPACDACARALH